MLTINEVFAFVTDDDGESLMSVRATRSRTPLIAVDKQSVASMRTMAVQDGRAFRILRFADREDITDRLPKRSNKDQAISAVSLIITIDEDGDEVIVTSPDRHLPLVAVYPQTVRSMIQLADSTGQPYRVIRFAEREDVTEQFVSNRALRLWTGEGPD